MAISKASGKKKLKPGEKLLFGKVVKAGKKPVKKK